MATEESFLAAEQTNSTCSLLPDDAIVVNEGTIKEVDLARQEEAGANLCRHFLRGRCHFGDRCRLSHRSLFHLLATEAALMPSSDTVEISKKEPECLDGSEKEEKNKRNRKKMSKSQKKEKTTDLENNEPLKKPRMRTADDVINRILWDSTIDSADFVVGHLDRFLGVLERPFDDFSWDITVADCDYSEELALPKHRIQYFNYRGQRVWDRDNRTDRVFGSTGQTVMPPFGGEAQHQEDIRQQEDNNLDSAEQQQMPYMEREESHENSTEAQTGEQDNTRTRNDSTCRTDSDGSPFRAPGGNSGGKKQTGSETSSDETEAGEEHSLGNLTQQLSISQTNNKIKSDEEQEREGDWDGEKDKEHLRSPERRVLSSGEPSGPQEPRPGRVKCRPTHFIGFRVDSPASLHAFQRIQAKVLAHLPQSEPHWVSSAKLHVTLSLLSLSGPAEVCAAAELLRTIVKELRKPPISLTFIPKLKHFAGKVLHLVPQPLSEIQTLNAPIQQAFRKNGWLHRDSRSPSYHMTLAKVEGGDRPFENVGAIKLGKDINFGKLEVQRLCLCLCKSPRTESGFYETVCAVTVPEI
ncbi:leukocyte receptor cluster member 9 isoform X3 [Clupea harengus]|uniref:Leukocyte receptor cluster member 9 isoform X3 n=1 Tax=Clupea harengus TaxID=7950 RepID=A0A6P8G9E8_CLUHA|nr:leukocyte receptor cluster member 9 isoform X3 [Clupea harengus]